MENWLQGGIMGGFGFGGMETSFGAQLRAFSAPFLQTADSRKIKDINFGGKAILPPSVLDHMMKLHTQYPVMLFKICNVDPDTQSSTHCGVLEFCAEEGRCYLPGWMMKQLRLDEGGLVRVDAVSLPKASYAKLKPQNLEFLNVTNPRAMLEVELRKFACLTKNDRIVVMYNEQHMEFLVQELKPKNAVCIIECDVNLEFDAPEGYVEEATPSKPSGPAVKPAAPAMPAGPSGASTAFAPFAGSGKRLDGKSNTSSSSLQEAGKQTQIPEAFCVKDYKPGKLSFVRYDYKCREIQEKELREQEAVSTGPAAFSGQGNTIRRPRY